jgi:hypothetical protein
MSTFEYTFAATAVITIAVEARDAQEGEDRAREAAARELRDADAILAREVPSVALMDPEEAVEAVELVAG